MKSVASALSQLNEANLTGSFDSQTVYVLIGGRGPAEVPDVSTIASVGRAGAAVRLRGRHSILGHLQVLGTRREVLPEHALLLVLPMNKSTLMDGLTQSSMYR